MRKVRASWTCLALIISKAQLVWNVEQSMPIQNVQTTTLNILPSASEGAESTRHWIVHVARKDARACIPYEIFDMVLS